MNTPTCAHAGCDERLGARHSHRARFCSTRCRVAAHRAAKRNPIPSELTTRDRWVRRSAAKVPMTVDAMPASSTNPRTWSTYETAAASAVGAGMGFVLSDVDDIVCLDLDHCLAPDGTLAPWASDIVSRAGATYIEVSPSGDGLHVFGYADVRQGRRIRRAGGYAVELYSDGRYIAMTGVRYRNAPSSLLNISALTATLV
ncbi:DNA primase [Streptomyces sp. NPDC001553]|uniref:DNA primase n=1 Tax=Streptomyces sp. NPDC001553 TaxID=3154385 RepID=UPI0033243C58